MNKPLRIQKEAVCKHLYKFGGSAFVSKPTSTTTFEGDLYLVIVVCEHCGAVKRSYV